jgi:hypothetical protein
MTSNDWSLLKGWVMMLGGLFGFIAFDTSDPRWVASAVFFVGGSIIHTIVFKED